MILCSDLSRPNGFEVVSGDGRSKVCLQCGDSVPGELEDWIDNISTLIHRYNKEVVSKSSQQADHVAIYHTHSLFTQMERYNNNLDEDEKVCLKMKW